MLCCIFYVFIISGFIGYNFILNVWKFDNICIVFVLVMRCFKERFCMIWVIFVGRCWGVMNFLLFYCCYVVCLIVLLMSILVSMDVLMMSVIVFFGFFVIF